MPAIVSGIESGVMVVCGWSLLPATVNCIMFTLRLARSGATPFTVLWLSHCERSESSTELYRLVALSTKAWRSTSPP